MTGFAGELYDFDNSNFQGVLDSDTRGYFARVYKVTEASQNHRPAAYKIMRLNHLPREADTAEATERKRENWRAFLTEARILLEFAHDDRVISMYGLGFVLARGEKPRMQDSQDDMRLHSADPHEMLQKFEELLWHYYDLNVEKESHWRPYLVLEYIPREYALYTHIRPRSGDTTHMYPAEVIWRIADQVTELLQDLQEKGFFFYTDHKPEHVYWLPGGQVKLIDFNGGWFTDQISDEKRTGLQHDDGRLFATMVLYAATTGTMLDKINTDNTDYRKRHDPNRRAAQYDGKNRLITVPDYRQNFVECIKLPPLQLGFQKEIIAFINQCCNRDDTPTIQQARAHLKKRVHFYGLPFAGEPPPPETEERYLTMAEFYDRYYDISRRLRQLADEAGKLWDHYQSGNGNPENYDGSEAAALFTDITRIQRVQALLVQYLPRYYQKSDTGRPVW